MVLEEDLIARHHAAGGWVERVGVLGADIGQGCSGVPVDERLAVPIWMTPAPPLVDVLESLPVADGADRDVAAGLSSAAVSCRW